MNTIFAVSGDSGSGKTTFSKKLCNKLNGYVFDIDRYHKWERNDPNWNTYTHLNTDANCMNQMLSDVEILRRGDDKLIVRDYSHINGKFTEPSEIPTSNLYIICGLHSSYISNADVYIFIDTDDELKRKWKVIRDIKDRGYTYTACEQIMNRRRTDFEKYVHIQKQWSNIIIKITESKYIVKCNKNNYFFQDYDEMIDFIMLILPKPGQSTLAIPE